jgi:hypothetical protein
MTRAVFARPIRWIFILAVLVYSVALSSRALAVDPVQNPQNGAVGLQAVVPADAPTDPPTILSPANSSVIQESTVAVKGSCKTGLIVRIYRNDIFSGSGLCENNSYSITIDLFGGTNTLNAKSFDALDQASPGSNTVTVQNSVDVVVSAPSKVVLSSIFASRGSQSGNEFTWPFSIGGGTGPYAVTVDWGDETSEPLAVSFAGDFNLKHIYKLAGIYRVTLKAVDSKGATSYFQVVAVASGEIKGAAATNGSVNLAAPNLTVVGSVLFYWWIFPLAIFVALSTFWLGKRHENHRLKKKVQLGEQPFR